jgi:hypothetical protein
MPSVRVVQAHHDAGIGVVGIAIETEIPVRVIDECHHAGDCLAAFFDEYVTGNGIDTFMANP